MYANFETTMPTFGFPNNTASGVGTTTKAPSIIQCCNWFGLYYYLVVILVCLTGLCILFVKMIIVARRHRYQRLRSARLRSQANGDGNNAAVETYCPPSNNAANSGTTTPTSDSPPTYEDAVANYIDAKQRLRELEAGDVGNVVAMTASTTTIETYISETTASCTDLTTPKVTAAPTAIHAVRETPKP